MTKIVRTTWAKKIWKWWQKVKIGYDPVKPKVGATVCAVPWMHLAFEPSGRVIPCCLTSPYNVTIGNLNKHSPEEIWNSFEQRKLRKIMMKGEVPDICSRCFDSEKLSGESSRVSHNREFPHVVKSIPNVTEPDGTVNEMKLRYWDFRFSNLCNFKCRSCSVEYSSSWAPDMKKLSQWRNISKVTEVISVGDQTNYNFLEEQVKHVEKIYFAGGEPLLMPEHWQTLELLVRNKRFDVRMCYNTNCSTLTYGKKNVIDYWKLWNKSKVEIWPSIDEVGQRAELIRSGTRWNIIESNLKQISNIDTIILRPCITVGAMNVFRLPEIIEYLTDIGVISERYGYTNFNLNYLENPTYYHVHILSEEFRTQIIERLKTWIRAYNTKYKTSIDYRFTQMLHVLTMPTDFAARKRFISLTSQLDKIRNERTYDTIPELKDVLREKDSGYSI